MSAVAPDLRGKIYRERRLMQPAETTEFLRRQKVANVGTVDVGRPDCPAHWNGASWRSVWRPTELKSREFVQAIAMSDNDPPTTTEAVHRLKQEIDCLAEEQRKALKLAIYVGMTTAEAKEHDQRWTRISELVQQLRILEKASDGCANKRI